MMKGIKEKNMKRCLKEIGVRMKNTIKIKNILEIEEILKKKGQI